MTEEARRITPIILSGGSGVKLWPLLSGQIPDPDASNTLLQLTAMRAVDPTRFEPPVIVANERDASIIEFQLVSSVVPPTALILEPMARNTAAAIALAALACPSDALMLVMPSDHIVSDLAAFDKAIEQATPAAELGWLVTFGIKPSRPETGYGYIRGGDRLVGGARRAEHFVEKPDALTAELYCAEGSYYWNAGLFLFRADVVLAALEDNVPAVAAAARLAMAAAGHRGSQIFPARDAFAASPDISIDYAVMETAENVAVVPVEMGWSDVGSWDALHELACKDGFDNAHFGEVLAINTANCLIRSQGPVIAAVDVQDLIIICSGNAVLIMPRGTRQEVKQVIETLKQSHLVTVEG